MEGTEKKRRLRRRRKPPPKKHFQASFLYQKGGGEGVGTQPVSTEEQEAFAAETISRLRLRSPPIPIDYRSRFSRIPEELQLTSQVVRRTLSQSSMRKHPRPATATDPRPDLLRAPLVTPHLYIAGLSAAVADKGGTRPVPRPSSSTPQTYFRYEKTKKVSVADHSQTDRVEAKYFNAEIIPKKQERTFTMADIQKYLQYIGTKPFR